MFGERNGNEKVLALSHISSLKSLTDEKGMRTMRGMKKKKWSRKSQEKCNGNEWEEYGNILGMVWGMK